MGAEGVARSVDERVRGEAGGVISSGAADPGRRGIVQAEKNRKIGSDTRKM